MADPLDLHYQHPRLAALYDLDSGWSKDREFYLNLAGKEPIDILDLGCGTGLICNAYAKQGHRVTGLDPSIGMLSEAKKSEFGSQINWFKSFSQDFELNQKFDLIIMTGHAFQTLLTDKNVVDTFKMVKKHLKPRGKFAFESRNPKFDWVSLWNHSYELNLKNEKISITRKILSNQNERIQFQTEYTFSDETLISKSDLRFMSKQKITDTLIQAGLSVYNFIGDWKGGDYNPTTSKEMIFTLKLS